MAVIALLEEEQGGPHGDLKHLANPPGNARSLGW